MATSHKDPDFLPQIFTIPARENHTATVIFLHGLGDTGGNIRWSLQTLTSHPDLSHVKFVLPTAPRIPVTGNKGRIMPSWYDCYSFDHATRREDEEGLFQAVKWVNEYISIEEKEHGIPPNRIIIGGISQGGSVATLATIMIEKPIAGLFGLSTYVPLRHQTMEYATPLSKKVPIFWGHGTEDEQVSYTVWKDLVETFAGMMGIPFKHFIGEKVTKDELQVNGTRGLRFYSYANLGHWFCEDELDDLVVWISFLLPKVSENK